jgi:hypothetical protein
MVAATDGLPVVHSERGWIYCTGIRINSREAKIGLNPQFSACKEVTHIFLVQFVLAKPRPNPLDKDRVLPR